MVRKNWEPHPGEAEINLLLPPEMPQGNRPGCILMPLPPGEEYDGGFLLQLPRRAKEDNNKENQPGCALMPQCLLLPKQEEEWKDQPGCTMVPRCG